MKRQDLVRQLEPSELKSEIRLAAAIRWYALGLISQERAAAIAGFDRTDFLMTLAREKVDSFYVDLNELAQEIGFIALLAGASRIRIF